MLKNQTNYSQKMQQYLESLEEERRKIQVFQRELPLCLDLISQAIETCKKELSFGGKCCEEQISSDQGPAVLQEFIPSSSSPKIEKPKNKSSVKSDWLKSVQLWNHTPDPVPDVAPKKNGSTGGAFQPFKRDITQPPPPPPPPPPPASASSTAGGKGEDKLEDSRKARRCWSSELHRHFLQALQQLGGAHVATPKQIRELMKVDGLTNDEVKSHLQKYRLHTRRPSSSSTQSNNIPQAPQFVVVGGLWMPPPQYASTVTTTSVSGDAEAPTHAPHNGIYAPKATLPSWVHPPAAATGSSKRSREFQPSDSGSGSGSGSEGRGCASSLATSSSTHTTIASHAF